MNELLPFLGMALLGLVAHWSKTIKSLRQAGEVHISIGDLINDRYDAGFLSICMAVAAVVVMREAGQLTLMAAFGAGYCVDSVTDLIDQKVTKIYR